MNLKIRYNADNFAELLCPFCRQWYYYENVLNAYDYTTQPMLWCECGALAFLEGEMNIDKEFIEPVKHPHQIDVTEIPIIKIDRILNCDLLKYKCDRQLSGEEVRDFISKDFNTECMKKYGIVDTFDNYTVSNVENINFNLGYVLDGYNLDDCHCLNLDHDGIYIFAIATDGRKFCFWGD